MEHEVSKGDPCLPGELQVDWAVAVLQLLQVGSDYIPGEMFAGTDSGQNLMPDWISCPDAVTRKEDLRQSNACALIRQE